MTAILQMRDAWLGHAIEQAVQARLAMLCVPPLGSVLVHHVDTRTGSARLAAADNGQVTCTIEFVIFTVTEAAVLARPNKEPAGAASGGRRADLLVTLAVVSDAATGQAFLRIVGQKLDFHHSGLPPAVQAIAEAALTPAFAVLSTWEGVQIDQLGAPFGATAEAPALSHGGGTLALRIAGPGPGSLPAALAWGMFLDGTRVARLIDMRGQGMLQRLRWAPTGSTPRVTGEVHAGVSITLPVIGDVRVAGAALRLEASLAVEGAHWLRIDISWDVEPDLLGSTILGTLGKAEARRQLRKIVRQKLVSSLPDAIHTGPRSFAFRIELPQVLPVFGARLVWKSALASTAGMAIGGPVVGAPEASRERLRAQPVAFGPPTELRHCRERRGGMGRGPRVEAWANFAPDVKLCEARLLSPNGALEPWMNKGDGGISFNLPVNFAGTISAPVRVLVRTSRGARLLDFGKPEIRRDRHGNVIVRFDVIPDCLILSGPWLKVSQGVPLGPGDFRPPPFEDPGWLRLLGVDDGFALHLIALRGLGPGEPLLAESQGMRVRLSADRSGTVLIPLILGFGKDMKEAVVRRLSGRPFEGSIWIETRRFHWLADLGPASAAVVRDVAGAAHIALVDSEGRKAIAFAPGAEQPLSVLTNDQGTMLNPQPLPPDPPPEARRLVAGANLVAVSDARMMPGASEAQLALATLVDGSTVVIDGRGRSPVVTGQWEGPVPKLLVEGGFALSLDRGSIHLFSVSSPERTNLNAGG